MKILSLLLTGFILIRFFLPDGKELVYHAYPETIIFSLAGGPIKFKDKDKHTVIFNGIWLVEGLVVPGDFDYPKEEPE